MVLSNAYIVYFDTSKQVDRGLEQTFYSEIINLAKLSNINEGYIIFFSPYTVGNDPEVIQKTAETLAASGADNLIIFSSAFVTDTEFPEDKYYMEESTDPEEAGDRIGYSFQEILSRQCNYLEIAGFETINNVSRQEYIIPYVFSGTKAGADIIHTAKAVAEFLSASMAYGNLTVGEKEPIEDPMSADEPEVDITGDVEPEEDAVPPVDYEDNDGVVEVDANETKF